MKRLFSIFAMLFIFMVTVQAQEVRPFRIGLKVGIPITVGATIEYVLPVVDNRIGIMADYGGFSISAGDASASYRYFSFGGNFYFSPNTVGRGFYGGLSYGDSKLNADYTGVESTQGLTITGSGSAEISIRQFQLRLGVKTGKGAFYFNPEIGYAISSVPSSVDFTATFTDSNGNTTTEQASEEIPASGIFGIMFSLTFGLSF